MALFKKGAQGASMRGFEVSPERKKRDARRRKRQEERWAKKAGEVETIQAEHLPPDSKLRPQARSPND